MMSSIFKMRLKDILLYNSKGYKKCSESFNDGTLKGEQLKRASEMAINSDRYNAYMSKYQRVGYILVLVTAFHIGMAAVAFFTVDIILYLAISAAVAMAWYALYQRKTLFALVGIFTCVFGIILNIGILNVPTSLVIWSVIVAAIIAGLLPSVMLLNREYIYLSKQDGFPHFKVILDDEIRKNQKALAGEINLYYANLSAPEGCEGRMDDIELSEETAEIMPDHKNDLMDSV